MAHQYLSAYDPDDEEDAIRALAASDPQPDSPPPMAAPADIDHNAQPDPTAVRGLAGGAVDDAPRASDVVSHTSDVVSHTPLKSDDTKGESPFGNVNGWAIVADLLTNRGRGLGQIMSVAHEQQLAQQRDKKEDRRFAADRSDKDRQFAREEKADERAAERDRRAATDDDMRKDMLLHPENYPLSHSEQLQKDTAEAMRAERTTDNERQDKRDAEIARHDQAMEGNERARAAAAAGAAARADAAAARAADRDARNAEHQRQSDSRQSERLDSGELHTFEKDTAKQRGLLVSLEQAQKIIDKYKNDADPNNPNAAPTYRDVPGLGLGSSAPGADAIRGLTGFMQQINGGDMTANNDAQAINDALTNAAQALVHGESGATFRPSEEEMAKIRAGSSATRTQAQALEAMRVLSEAYYRDLAGQSGIVANKDRLRASLIAGGLNPDRVLGAAPPPPAADDAPASARDAMPKVRPLSTGVQLQDPSPEELKKRYERFGISFE